MKDYSNFVNLAYLATFVIIGLFSFFSLWQFQRNSKKLKDLRKDDQKGGKN